MVPKLWDCLQAGLEAVEVGDETRIIIFYFVGEDFTDEEKGADKEKDTAFSLDPQGNIPQ